MTSGKEDFVDVKTIAIHLGVGKSFIYKLISEKKIPYYKIGSKFVFKLSEVDLVLEKEMRYA